MEEWTWDKNYIPLIVFPMPGYNRQSCMANNKRIATWQSLYMKLDTETSHKYFNVTFVLN